MAEFRGLKKTLGPFGFLADALSVGTANWGVIVSGVIAFGAVIWARAYSFVTDQHVRTFGVIFLLTTWTYIALSLLYRFHRGIRTIPVVDYTHGLVLENVGLAYDKDDDEKSVQIAVGLRSVVNGPVQIEVHDFRVIIAGRTIPDSPAISMVIPRFGQKGIVSGTFARDAVKDRAEGFVHILLHYGPVGARPVRKFKSRLKLYIRIADDVVGVANTFDLEEDLPL